jgi:uncharacterized protein
MDRRVNRRHFLKAATAASGVLAYAGTLADPIARASGAAASTKITDRGFTPIADYPIQPKHFSDVALEDAFWKPKVALNASVTIPLEVEKLAATPRGLTGNVLEAAILSLKTHADPALQAQVDAAVAAAARVAPRDGNNGFEAAVTLYNTTGNRELLDRAIGIAVALYDDFDLNDPPFSGGERDAINCVQLYRVTHDVKHLALAKHYLDIRGLENSVNRSRHNQSYKPVLEQTEAVGHAVNGVSLMVSLADVGTLAALPEYFQAAERMWSDAVARKMYVTGGVGSTGNEGFGEPYSLPNISAYSETCAVLMFITLNHRLFLATGDSQYIDVMERGMYNNAIAGVAASGDRFFYVNRLASAGDGRDLRWQHASLECCPPNLVRFMASMPGFIYAQDAQGAVFVNLYVSSAASFMIGGRDVRLSVESEMPWGGRSTITLATGGDAGGAIKLRVPGWARDRPAPGGLYRYTDTLDRQTMVSVNGMRVAAVPDKDGYVTLDRVWKNGDIVGVEFPIAVRQVIADSRVSACVGRIAIERGPIVYCAEWPEAESGRVLDVVFDTPREARVPADGLTHGATLVQMQARRMGDTSGASKTVTLIPYHLWANRGAGEMTVWLPSREYIVGDIGPAGGVIFFVNPAHAAAGWRFLEAAPADQSGGAKWGCFRAAIAGARGTAVGTGRQNTRDMIASCGDAETAAALCANYTLNGVGGWFLPSRDELALMHERLAAAGLGHFPEGGARDNVSYWSSTQNDADMAAHIDFADNGRQHIDDKDFPRRVRAIRAF